MYLLDTNVVSELRRTRPHGAVLAWIRGIQPDRLFLSSVTLGELQAGVELTRDQNPGRAAEIEDWIEAVAQTYSILPVDERVFRLWAKLLHHRPTQLSEDALIAATALVHGLTLVTRNTRDFEVLGVPSLNPFEPVP